MVILLSSVSGTYQSGSFCQYEGSHLINELFLAVLACVALQTKADLIDVDINFRDHRLSVMKLLIELT